MEIDRNPLIDRLIFYASSGRLQVTLRLYAKQAAHLSDLGLRIEDLGKTMQCRTGQHAYLIKWNCPPPNTFASNLFETASAAS